MKLVQPPQPEPTEPVAVRVEMEYEDGTVKVWRGQIALDWLKASTPPIPSYTCRAGANPRPRYDDVYYNGMEWLDKL